MKLQVLCVGRLAERFLKDGCDQYANRLQHYLPLSITELKEHKSGKKPDIPRIINNEGQAILQKISPNSFVVALDERGKSLSSVKLADLLQRHMLDGTAEIILVIGGPFGLSQTVLERADLRLSLSAMTMTHQMVRLLLLEQLYRACTIIRNEPYHHA